MEESAEDRSPTRVPAARREIDYAITIRTLGRGGEKYRRLLQSIRSLEDEPREVIVVLPEDCDPPEDRLGYETFVHSPKGMVEQRLAGMAHCRSRYLLMLDDDVAFEGALVAKLYESLIARGAAMAFPICEKLLFCNRTERVLAALTLSGVPRWSRDDHYVRFLRTGGFSYPTSIESLDLYSESAPGMCVFGDVEVCRRIDLREDAWVQYPDYELREDAALIYKGMLRGHRTVGRTDVAIEHLDNAVGDRSRRLQGLFALGCSQLSFWKRYIYDTKPNNVLNVLGITYWVAATSFVWFVVSLKHRNFEELRTFLRGVARGVRG